jgi:hypothetical protein
MNQRETFEPHSWGHIRGDEEMCDSSPVSTTTAVTTVFRRRVQGHACMGDSFDSALWSTQQKGEAPSRMIVVDSIACLLYI